MTGRPSHVALRIALAFVAVFFLVGVHMPYWPVWLQAQGLSPSEVGWVLGVAPWMRVISNPLVGRWADRTGRAPWIATGLALVVAGIYAVFSVAHGFLVLLALAVILGLAFSPLIVLTDTLAVHVAADGSIAYGRLRRWGSASFIGASVIGGWLIERYGVPQIVWVLFGAAVAIAAVSFVLPSVSPHTPSPDRPRGPGMRALLKRPTFRWFLATTAMLQGSHAMLYAFGSPHWHDHGIDATTIGWLWAIGVIAEIALFSLGPRLVGRLSPMRLLTAAALGGLVRWPVLGLTTQLAFVFPAQVLHALTFGALHLGAMEYVRRTIEPQATGTATALYAATSGVALGIGVPAVGMLYESLQGSTYMVMAVCSGVSLLGLLMLRLSGKRSLAA